MLTQTQREAVVTELSTDLAAVLWHVLHDEAYPLNATVAAVIHGIVAGPLDLRALNRVTGWVLFELRFRAGGRALTTNEHRILAAAWRLSDRLHGPRTH